jgi:hypothetical protein
VHGRGIDPLHSSVLEWLADRAAVELEAPARDVEDPADLDDDAAASSSVPQLEELQRLTLGELAARHADVRGLRSWIRALRDTEETGRARMLRLRLQGRLMPVETVERLFEAVDSVWKLLLSSAPIAIAVRIAPDNVATVAPIVRDLMSQNLEAARDRMSNIVESNDPLAPIPVPREQLECTGDEPPWGESA